MKKKGPLCQSWNPCNKIEVGDVVYEPFAPLNCGVVVGEKIVPNGRSENHLIEVDFRLKRVRKFIICMNIKKLDDLILEHKKRYEGHLKRKSDLLSLDPTK